MLFDVNSFIFVIFFCKTVAVNLECLLLVGSGFVGKCCEE